MGTIQRFVRHCRETYLTLNVLTYLSKLDTIYVEDLPCNLNVGEEKLKVSSGER